MFLIAGGERVLLVMEIKGEKIMINILMCGNNFVFKGWVITSLSLVKYTKDPITLTFFTMDLTNLNRKYTPVSKEQADYIEKILKSANPESKVVLLDLTKEFNKQLINSVNINSGFTPFAMLRLLADEVEMPDKFVYLDTDTIVNQDISILYNFNIDGYELGVVKDAYRINPHYFNSGVMLVNQKLCKTTGIYQKARDIVTYKHLIYTDQTALNKACTKRLMLPLIFNAKDKYYKSIVVHHFCNVRKKGNWFHRVKPWETDLVKQRTHAYDDILDDYEKRMLQSDWPKK